MPTAEWIDPDGTTWPLTVEYDTRGLFAPPARLQEDTVPGQPGLRLREVTHDAREVVLSLYWRNDDPAALHTTLRQITAAMDPARGVGKLRVTAPTADQRELNCVVTGGMDFSQTLGEQATPTHQRAAVVFRAHDPYWHATSDTVTDYTLGSTATFFPILPIRLTDSATFADATITNTGDVDTWPVWQITGPASPTIGLRNLTTGKTATFGTTTLTAAETVTVDTRPGVKTITRQDGTNLFPALNGSLWPLRRGSNAIRVEMAGTTAATKVRVSYRPRWLTP